MSLIPHPTPNPLELVCCEALLNCRARNWTELAGAEHSGRTQSSPVIILHIICHPKAYLLFVQVITGNPIGYPAPGHHPAFATAVWQVTNHCSSSPETITLSRPNLSEIHPSMSCLNSRWFPSVSFGSCHFLHRGRWSQWQCRTVSQSGCPVLCGSSLCKVHKQMWLFLCKWHLVWLAPFLQMAHLASTPAKFSHSWECKIARLLSHLVHGFIRSRWDVRTDSDYPRFSVTRFLLLLFSYEVSCVYVCILSSFSKLMCWSDQTNQRLVHF